MQKSLQEALQKQGALLRTLHCEYDDGIDFSTNDYLGLSALSPPISCSFGASGSRLLSGNHPLFLEFEKKIAQDKKQEASLLFSSGYQANITALSTLISITRPVIFFDRLNHASLYDALKLAGATCHRYHDVTELRELLLLHDQGKSLIVTETLFGMDGHKADLESIVSLCKEFNAFLYLDEAHATGVFGENGYGLSTEFDLTDVQCLIMGSFSKALGGAGAYVASTNLVRDVLINFGRGFIYTTAPSPALMEAIYALWCLLPSYAQERVFLRDLGGFARHKLQSAGFNIGKSTTHIIPILMSSNEAALSAKQLLKQNNIHVSLVRAPSVPLPRLRVGLTIKHTEDDILSLMAGLSSLSAKAA